MREPKTKPGLLCVDKHGVRKFFSQSKKEINHGPEIRDPA